MFKTINLNDPSILNRDIYWMLAFAFILLPIILIPKKYEIGRFEGIFLVVGYTAFIVLAFQ